MLKQWTNQTSEHSAALKDTSGDQALDADELSDEQLGPVVGGLTWDAVLSRLAEGNPANTLVLSHS